MLQVTILNFYFFLKIDRPSEVRTQVKKDKEIYIVLNFNYFLTYKNPISSNKRESQSLDYNKLI